MIRFDTVSKRYPPGRDALSRVSFELAAGEMAFLTGHSGAGKSTLMGLITRTLLPTSGTVMVNDIDVAHLRRGQVPYLRRSIGVVYQDHKLLMDRSVYDNVALPLEVAGFAPRDTRRRVHAALDKVGLLDREGALPVALSGGECQRIGIARAVVHKPSVLLADEPTGNLDPQLSVEIMDLFRAFNRVGVSVLIASHDLALVARMRYRVLTLHNGRLVNQQQQRGEA